MAEVLDQSQVEALLAAVDTGDVQEEASSDLIFSRTRRADDPVEIRAYDFKRPERVSKDQMLALQTLHEAFARNFGASLSGFLRTIVEVKVATCEQMTYAEFISGLANPTSFNLITADTLEGTICLEISPLIIYPIIDRLLGGSSQDLFIPQRPMTLIEARLISNVTSRGLAALSEAWSTVKTLQFSVSATESNPQLVQIVPPNEVVVMIGFELKLANRAGTMNLCIPYNVIEPVMDKLSAQSWFSTSRTQRTRGHEQQIGTTLHRATLEISGCLARTTISLADLLGMSIGDVILTEKPASSEVVVHVEGEAKFLAMLGRHRDKLALRVTRPVAPSDRI